MYLSKRKVKQTTDLRVTQKNVAKGIFLKKGGEEADHTWHFAYGTLRKGYFLLFFTKENRFVLNIIVKLAETVLISTLLLWMSKKGIIKFSFALVRIITTISHPTVMFQGQSSKNLAAFQTFFKVFQTFRFSVENFEVYRFN